MHQGQICYFQGVAIFGGQYGAVKNITINNYIVRVAAFQGYAAFERKCLLVITVFDTDDVAF